jgi:hypothetical protein
MWQLCQQLDARVEHASWDSTAVADVVEGLTDLRHQLEQSIRAYRAQTHPLAGEAREATRSLTLLAEDLTWSRLAREDRRRVRDGEVRECLDHALHAARNALALLRWAAASTIRETPMAHRTTAAPRSATTE